MRGTLLSFVTFLVFTDGWNVPHVAANAVSERWQQARETAADFADRARDMHIAAKIGAGVAVAGAAAYGAHRFLLSDAQISNKRGGGRGGVLSPRGRGSIESSVNWDCYGYEKIAEQNRQIAAAAAAASATTDENDGVESPLTETTPLLEESSAQQQQPVTAHNNRNPPKREETAAEARQRLVRDTCGRWKDRLRCVVGVSHLNDRPWAVSAGNDDDNDYEDDVAAEMMQSLPVMYLYERAAPYIKLRLLENRLLSSSPKRLYAGISRKNELQKVSIETYSPLVAAQEESLISQVQFYRSVHGSGGFPQLRSVYRQASAVPEWNLVFDRFGETLHSALGLRRTVSFSQATVVRMFAHLFKALAKMHNLGVCHCGITPRAIVVPMPGHARPILSDLDNHIRWSSNQNAQLRPPRSHCAASSADHERIVTMFRQLNPQASEQTLPMCTTVDIWSLTQAFYVTMLRVHPEIRIELAENREDAFPQLTYATQDPEWAQTLWGQLYYKFLDRLDNLAAGSSDSDDDNDSEPPELDNRFEVLFKQIFTSEADVPSASRLMRVFATMQKQPRTVRFE